MKNPGDIPQLDALQAIIDDLVESAPIESLDDLDTPEGLLLDCLADAMFRYESKYWPMGDEEPSK